jgi:hypothetical protein
MQNQRFQKTLNPLFDSKIFVPPHFLDRNMLWHPTLQEEIFHIWGLWYVIVALMGVFHMEPDSHHL